MLKIALLSIFSLLSFTSPFPEPFFNAKTETIKIYLCSRLTQEARAFNNTLRPYFDERFCVFFPQDLNLSSFSEIEKDDLSYLQDSKAIKSAHLLLVIPPYGRDCAWEIGYAKGLGIKTAAYIETQDLNWLQDAMVKGGIDFFITPSEEVKEIILKFPLLKNRVVLCPTKASLSDNLCKIFLHDLN